MPHRRRKIVEIERLLGEPTPLALAPIVVTTIQWSPQVSSSTSKAGTSGIREPEVLVEFASAFQPRPSAMSPMPGSAALAALPIKAFEPSEVLVRSEQNALESPGR